jgi:hypothetical protein
VVEAARDLVESGLITAMMSAHDWETELAKIDWSRYQTAYGEANRVKAQLQRLRSDNREEALQASHDLWCGLCHQHVQIGSAALPALPLLIDAFPSADDQLKIELLDIFLGLAVTSNPQHRRERDDAQPQWIDDVRVGLTAIVPMIAPLQMDTNPDIAYFSKAIVDELNLL